MLCLLVSLAAKIKGIDLDAPGNINGVSVVDVDMESFEEKPWRKPGTFMFIITSNLVSCSALFTIYLFSFPHLFALFGSRLCMGLLVCCYRSRSL